MIYCFYSLLIFTIIRLGADFGGGRLKEKRDAKLYGLFKKVRISPETMLLSSSEGTREEKWEEILREIGVTSSIHVCNIIAVLKSEFQFSSLEACC